jgi:hypothetical protein
MCTNSQAMAMPEYDRDHAFHACLPSLIAAHY